MATCGFENMEIVLGEGTKFIVTKDFSAMFIVITDMLVVFVIVVFIFIIERKKARYQELYKDYMI